MSVHSLPVEVLARIFIHGAPTYPSPFLLRPHHRQPLCPNLPSLNFQILVSHVCLRWRSIALETAPLWTTLVFLEASHIRRANALLSRIFPTGPLQSRHSVPSLRTLTILISTVDQASHTPGVTIAKPELRDIFNILLPYLSAWRAFHLVVRDNECKAVAREYLGSCGPGSSLETLQLYHFENYKAAQDLYLATYRAPVCVFQNTLPRLRNVSLIGVNLPWERSPYLYDGRLRKLELALHADKIRLPYRWWERLLRGCGADDSREWPGAMSMLEELALHYSGPKVGVGEEEYVWKSADDNRFSTSGQWRRKIWLPRLEKLSLTDLDPDYLCKFLETLILPAVNRLEIGLPEQDFTPFINMLGETTSQSHAKEDSSPPASPDSSHESEDSSTTMSPETAVSSMIQVFSETDSSIPESKNPGSCASAHADTNNRQYRLALKCMNVGVLTFPALYRLEYLAINALECSGDSLHGFLRALTGLKFLEINFGSVSQGFWSVLMECRDVAHSSVATRIPTLLPSLETFQISGLEGEKVGELIRWRSKPLLYGRTHTVKRWFVRWTERMRGRDLALDEIVETGVNVATQDGVTNVRVIDYNEDDDDEDDEDEVDDLEENETDEEGEGGE
ncbi:hypothetical protein APHAL10511_008330 [Amanita phalloides]|nr:hypothetical protein APHAL10511_008330 [Amanita phalloides]